MRIDQELVMRGLCESRQEAQECVEQGFVFLDGQIVTKKTRQVDKTSNITITQTRKFVSRGGDKLEGALIHVYPGISSNTFKDKIALDVGSSTGGFTDCLLSHGVSHVTAIDVGTSQLHDSLRSDKRVLVFEKTDIRDYISESKFDIIVADVSFIALEKIVDTILSFGHKYSEYFLLIKPQFEVGFGNTKKGIVKDAQLVEMVLTKYETTLRGKGCTSVTLFPCSIKGGDGNQEYFIYAKASSS